MPIYIHKNGVTSIYGMAVVQKQSTVADPRIMQLILGGGVLDLSDVPLETLPEYAIYHNYDGVIFPNTLVEWNEYAAEYRSIGTLDFGGCTRFEGEKNISFPLTYDVKELVLPNSINRINHINTPDRKLEKVSFRGKMVGDIMFYETFHDLIELEHFSVEANSDVILYNRPFTNNTSLLDVTLSADGKILENDYGNFVNCPNLYKIVLDSPKIDLNLPALFYNGGDSRYLELYMPRIEEVIDITENFYNIDELNVFVPYSKLNEFKEHSIWQQYNIGITDPDEEEQSLVELSADKSVVSYRGGDIIKGNSVLNNKQIKNGEEVAVISSKEIYERQNEEIYPNLSDSPRTVNVTFGENRFPYSVTQNERKYTYHLRFKVDSSQGEQKFSSRIIPLNVFNNRDWSIYDDNGNHIGKIAEFKINDGEWISTKKFDSYIERVKEQGGDLWWTGYVMGDISYVAPADGEYDIYLRLKNDELRGDVNGDNRFFTDENFVGDRVFDVINQEIIYPSELGYYEHNRNIVLFEIGEDLNIESGANMVWDNYSWNGQFGGESGGSPLQTFIVKSFNNEHHDNQILGHQDLENCVIYEHPNFQGGSLGYDRLCGWNTNCVNLVFANISKETYVDDYWFEGNLEHIYVPANMLETCKSWKHECWQRNQEIIEVIPDGFSF